MTMIRPYGGVEALDRIAERRDRLLDAGLQLLGGADQPAALTVRAVCALAGTSPRYFYESFSDKDQLVTEVFDWVVTEIAATTQAAVAAAPRNEQNRAGIANLVRVIADDTRVGRLLFNPQLSHPTLARKRAELGGIFALLSGRHVQAAFGSQRTEGVAGGVQAIAHFVVGGVGQTLSAWVCGDLSMTQPHLVDRLTHIVDGLTAAQSSRD